MRSVRVMNIEFFISGAYHCSKLIGRLGQRMADRINFRAFHRENGGILEGRNALGLYLLVEVLAAQVGEHELGVFADAVVVGLEIEGYVA